MKYIYILLFLLSVITVPGQTPEQLKSYLPAVSGWTLPDQTEIFDEDNLFDRINGAAPLFIENNFQEMTSLEYTKGNDYITIQIYRHATPEDAFGMYASERSSDLNFLPIGGEAQGDENHLYFFAGNVYVKMWSNLTTDIAQVMQSIGKQLAGKIDPQADYPVVMKAFPTSGQIPYSMGYTTANYIGHEFLKSVYTTKYDIDGKTIQAFVIDGQNTEGAKEVLRKYFTFTKQSPEHQEGEILIQDRYNGDIPVIWKGRYIIGLFDENGEDTSENKKLIAEIADSL